MTDIIARLQEATEGSRELDAEIALAIGWKRWRIVNDRPRYGSGNAWQPPSSEHGDVERLPDYTTSVDAALTLVPKGWNIATLRQHKNSTSLSLWCPVNTGLGHMYHAEGHTTALAICIAALKARATHGDET